MSKYTFINGSSYSGSRASIEITKRYDTCVVDIASYIDGRVIFPCASGEDMKLSQTDVKEINTILSKLTGIKNFSREKVKQVRAELKNKIAVHKQNFYEWKDCMIYVTSEMNLNMDYMYLTCGNDTINDVCLGLVD